VVAVCDTLGVSRLGAVLCSALGVVLVGCGGGGAGSDAYTSSCHPPFPQVSSHKVRPGGSVVLTNPGLRCHPYFAGPQTYTITFDVLSRTHMLVRTAKVASVRAGVTGAFRVTLHISTYVRPGQGIEINLDGPRDDERWCPPDADCGTETAGVGVVGPRASLH
jgi:hypothetical protein